MTGVGHKDVLEKRRERHAFRWLVDRFGVFLVLYFLFLLCADALLEN